MTKLSFNDNKTPIAIHGNKAVKPGKLLFSDMNMTESVSVIMHMNAIILFIFFPLFMPFLNTILNIEPTKNSGILAISEKYAIYF